eukprot:scaffold174542_cov18-Tisochrysis_lutea.AAC.1
MGRYKGGGSRAWQLGGGTKEEQKHGKKTAVLSSGAKDGKYAPFSTSSTKATSLFPPNYAPLEARSCLYTWKAHMVCSAAAHLSSGRGESWLS